MRSPLARISRARFILCAAACLAVLLAPARSFATHWIVDQSGGGDFTTIQAALDAWATGLGWRESVLVMPGTYPETMAVGGGASWMLLAVGGPAGTAANSIAFVEQSPTTVEGFTFTHHVELNNNCGGSVMFTGCVFGATFSGSFDGPPSFEDCDFYGRTSLRLENPGFSQFRAMRFHAAPLWIDPYNGTLTLTDCLFEGPADTLVFFEGIFQGDYVFLVGCRFANAQFGLVMGDGNEGPYFVTRCTFSNLSGTAVWHDTPSIYPGPGWVSADISDSRFQGCGTAIHWRDPSGWGNFAAGATISVMRDTISSSTRDGIEIGQLTPCSIADCIIEGGDGDGVVIHEGRPAGLNPKSLEWVSTVTNSILDSNREVGLAFRDSTPGGSQLEPQPTNVVQDCTFTRNGSTGLEVGCGVWAIQRCVSFANGGDGFALDTSEPQGPRLLASNTSTLNRGDGFRLTSPASPRDSLQLVHHNLAALNTGAGFRVPPQSFGSFAFNDAWSNYQGQYVGAWGSADSNLTVDPRFCELGAGDLGLQQGSPAGAGGIYGLIGALPEQCPNTTVVEPTAPRLSFAVRPTVARGSVEFVPPSTGPDGRVEIFDVTGRRHWGAAFGPTTGSLRWTGQSETGHAQSGLYWVRFTRAGETQSQRLVWLR